MAPKKPKKTKEPPPNTPDHKQFMSSTKTFPGRDGLGAYIEHPEKYPPDRVVQYDDDFVVINDMFPKASVHLLLLPRDPLLASLHPLKALSTNPALLATIRQRVDALIPLVASELRRQFGQYSASDRPYREAYEAMMSGPDPPTPDQRAPLLPPGRDWTKDVVAGVHTHPSMNHLHIHIFSRDMYSPRLKHKKHYLSFNSEFLVKLSELPLEEGSARFHGGDWPGMDMKCWRCGRNFGNKFAALKEHLGEEFEAWKRE